MGKRVIWKYELLPTGEIQVIDMPAGAAIHHVALQERSGGFAIKARPKIQMWAEVDPDLPNESRQFFFVGTGHREIEPSDLYLGTIQLHGGELVLHLYAKAQ